MNRGALLDFRSPRIGAIIFELAGADVPVLMVSIGPDPLVALGTIFRAYRFESRDVVIGLHVSSDPICRRSMFELAHVFEMRCFVPGMIARSGIKCGDGPLRNHSLGRIEVHGRTNRLVNR